MKKLRILVVLLSVAAFMTLVFTFPSAAAAKDLNITGDRTISEDFSGNITITDGTLRVASGASLDGSIAQKGTGGVVVEKGASVAGNVKEEGPGNVEVYGSLGGNIEEMGDGDVIVDLSEGASLGGRIREQGAGNVVVWAGNLPGNIEEQDDGSVVLEVGVSVAGNVKESGDGEVLSPFTVSFDSNGGRDIAPIRRYEGQALGVLPVPNKDNSIFLGWYLDDESFENKVSELTTATSELTLYARYAAIGALQEADQVPSVSAMDEEPNSAIDVVSSDSSMTADAVKAALQLEVVDNTPFAGLSVSGSGGAYTVTATEGYTPGSSYKLTLTNAALHFAGDPTKPIPESVRTYCFTIAKPPVDNLQFAATLIQIPAADVSNITMNGVLASSLSLPLATTEAGLTDMGNTGTFTYTGSETLAIGDTLAIYEGSPPDQRSATMDYSDQAVAYVVVTAIDGDTVSYGSPEATDVLFTPDVLPVKAADDLDADANSITIPVSKMTYSDAQYAEMGLNAATVVEEGDFLAIQTGSSEADAAVSFAKIISVVLSGSNYTIAYVGVTEDEVKAAMDLYSSHDADYGAAQIDVPATEAAIKKQAIDSGFAEAAAEYLTDLALKTDGFKKQLDAAALLTPSEIAAASVITGLVVTVDINRTVEHFPGYTNGLDCGVRIEFDVAIGEDLNLHLSGTFEQELRVTLNTSGGAVWRTKRVWFIPIPYIADYRMTGNVDLFTYTGIDINATLTSGGGGGPIDIAQEIQEMMGAQNYQPEEISAECQEFYELYADMLANEHEYVPIIEQQIAHMESAIDPFHILVGGLTLEFVVNADVNLSIGAQFDYTKGTRYVFTLLLFSKTSTSSQVDLVDETYNFDFYVMGTLGLRAGLIARVELGLFSLSLDSIGLELEVGPYIRLWGYFFYELHYANHVRTSNTSGALYLELGIYLETRFLAQVLNGQYSYNPTIYEHEWPLWSAGSRYNIYDFSYNLTDATDDIRMKGATRTYALPASVLSMKQLDLTEGDISSTSHSWSEFTTTFTNSSFSQTNGTITVVPPAGQHITEGYMTVNWIGAPMSFTTVPISRTYHLVWDDLASSYMISFNSQGGTTLSPTVGPYGSAVTLPTPTRAGYTFGGWYLTSACTGTAYTTATMPASNPTLYAKWTAIPIPYTVRHYQQSVGGTSYVLFATDNLTGTSGSSVTPVRNTYAGFTAPAAQTVTINGDGSTVVQYYYTRNSYQLTFRPGSPDPDIVRTVVYGGQLAPPAVARAGYSFGGWYLTADLSGAAYAGTTMPAGNLLLYAKWTANANTPYAVRHYQERLASGVYDLVATQNLTGPTGGSVTPPLNTYTGFTAPPTQTLTINGNGSTLIAYYYTRNIYDLICHPNDGGSDISSRLPYGANLVLPSVTRAGYTFGGWYDNAGFSGTAYTASGTMPAVALQLHAKWTANTDTPYTVEHRQEIVAGELYGVFETETLYGATGTAVTPAVKTYEGFTSPETQTVTINGDGSTVVTYDYARNSYEVIYHPNNGEPDIVPTPLRYGETLVPPPVTRENFVFDGWFTNAELSGDPYVASTMPANNLQLWAKWKVTAGVLSQVNARSDLIETDYIDWMLQLDATGALWNPYAYPYGRAFRNPPYYGVRTGNGQDVLVTSQQGVQFSVDGQGWSWAGSFGDHDVVMHNEGGGNGPWSSLASPIYDPLTIDFGSHPILAGGAQLEAFWHGDFTARVEAFDSTGSSLGSFTVSGNSPGPIGQNNHRFYYGDGSGPNTAPFLGVTSEVPIRKLVFTLLTCGPGGASYQFGQFAINRLSIVSAPAPAPTISHELSSGIDATVSAPVWVNDTVTLAWESTDVPTGSILVTGTMPDGTTWEVDTEAIPADATSPFTFSTANQGLGTGESWAGGVLGEGLYQFQAEYLPAADSPFPGAVSEVEQVTVVDPPEYAPGAPLSPSPVVQMLEGAYVPDQDVDFRDWYDISLADGDCLTVRVTNWTGGVAADMRIRVLHNGVEVDAGTTWPWKDKTDTWAYSVPLGGGGVYSLLVETVGGGGTYSFEYSITEGTPVGWYDGFDSYQPGSDMNGVGGWQEPYVGAGSPPLTVSNDYYRSAPYSLKLTPESSTVPRTVVHGFPATSGVWKVEMWWYVPAGANVDIQFWLSATSSGYVFLNGMGSNMYPLISPYVFPLVTGEWVPVSFVVDLDNNLQRIYYNNTYAGQSSYLPDTIEFGVQPKGGGSITYLDDVSVMPATWPVS